MLAYLRSAKLGFVCAQVLRKRQKLPSISTEVKSLIFPFEMKEIKGKSFEDLSTVKKKPMPGKIVKCWIQKAPCSSVNKAFLLLVVKKGIKQQFETMYCRSSVAYVYSAT